MQSAANGPIGIPDFNAIVLAQDMAQDLAAAAQAAVTHLTETAANPASLHLANLIGEAGLEISNDGSILDRASFGRYRAVASQ